MRWRTPPELVAAIEARFGTIDVDAAAEDANAIAARWFTAEQDCLFQDWRRGHRFQSGDAYGPAPDIDPSKIRTIYINPPWGPRGVPKWAKEQHPTREFNPFIGTGRFVQKAWEESRRGPTVLALLPQSLDAVWMKPWLVRADEILIGRRFRFLRPDGTRADQPPGGHLLLVFRSHVPESGWPGGPRTEWDWNPLASS